MENNLQGDAIKILAGAIGGALLTYIILSFMHKPDVDVVGKIETIKSIVCE